MNLNSGNISLICNLVLVGVGVLVLISALFGIRKGLWKASAKLVSWAILLTIVYVFNTKFTELYFNINLGMFNLPTNFEFMGMSLNLSQPVGKIIEDVLVGMNAAKGAIAITALAESILSLVVLIVHLLLCLLLCPLLTFILYHLIVKPIFGSIIKKHKLRIGGAVINATKTLLVAVCFLMPLFSMTETLLKNYEEGIGENYQYNKEKSNQYWDMVYPIMFGYQSSFLHTFCSIITGTGIGNSYLTFQTDKGVPVNFLDITGDFFAVACSALSTAEGVSSGALVAAMLSDKTLDMFTEKVLNSTFIISEIIPVAVSVGLNYAGSMEDPFIEKDEIDRISAEIDNIDFKNDLSSYIQLFKVLNEEGFVSNGMDTGNFDFEFDRKNQSLLNRALGNFEVAQDAIKEDESKTTILDLLIPSLLASMVRNSKDGSFDLSELLPTETESYRKYDMIELLKIVSDVMFNMNDIYRASSASDVNLSTGNLEQLQRYLLDILFKRENVFDGVADSRNGERKIFSLNLYNGLQIGEDAETGEAIYDYGLLDSDLIVDIFPAILDYVLNIITGSDENANGFTLTEEMKEEIENTIKDYDTKEEWYGELDALTKFISCIYKNEKLPILPGDENGGIGTMGDINIDDKDQRDELGNAIEYIDGSIVATTLLPSVIRDTLKVDTIAIFNDYNITIDDFNFDRFTAGKGLGSELRVLLDAYGYISGMDLSGNLFANPDLETERLEEALCKLEECEILNPKVEDYPLEQNVFRKMLLGIFNSEDMQQIGIHLDEEIYDENSDRLNKVYDENGNVTDPGEISAIIGILDTAKEGGLGKFLSTGDEAASLTDLKGDDIKNLVNAIAVSDFLRPCLSDVLKKQAGPSLEENGIYLNFDSMRDADQKEWEDEATHLGGLLDGINALLDGQEFSEIDWVEVIELKNEEIHTLLDEMVKLHMIDGELYIDAQNNVLDEQAEGVEEAFPDYFSGDMGMELKKEFSFYYHRDDLKITPVDFDLEETDSPTRVDYWEKEIDRLMDVFATMKYFIVEDPKNDNRKALDITEVNEDNREALGILMIGGKVNLKDEQAWIEKHKHKDTENQGGEGESTTQPLSEPGETGGEDSENIVYRKGINDVFIMRTLLSQIASSIFTSDTSEFNIDGLDLKKIHSSLLAKEYNYLAPEDIKEKGVDTRTIEVTKRHDALQTLLNIESKIETLTKLMGKGEGMEGDGGDVGDAGGDLTLAKFAEHLEDIFYILEQMKESPFFHKGYYGIDRQGRETTFFEDTVTLILNESNLSTLNYDEGAPRDSRYNTPKDKTLSQVFSISANDIINDNERETEKYRDWDVELGALYTMMKKICEDSNFNNIQDPNAAVDDLNIDKVVELLGLLNSCYLTHDAVGNMIKIVLDQTHIANAVNAKENPGFRLDVNEDATAPDYFLDKYIIDAKGDDLDFQDQVAVWNEELVNIEAMKTTLDKFAGEGSIGDKFNGTAVPEISNLLSITGGSRILKPMYADFLFNIFDKSGLSDKISEILVKDPVTTPMDELKKDTKEQRQRNTIQYLINERIKPTIDAEGKSPEWAQEGATMDNLLNKLKEHNNLNLEEGMDNDTIDLVSEIFSSVYTYSGTPYMYSCDKDFDSNQNDIAKSEMTNPEKYTRSYIASEILLNFFDDVFSKLGVTYFEDIHSDYDYRCFNDYEKEGIEAILNIFIQLSGITVSEIKLTDRNSISNGIKNVMNPLNDALAKPNVERMRPAETTIPEYPKRDTHEPVGKLLTDGWNSNICAQLLNSGYLEEALVKAGVIEGDAEGKPTKTYFEVKDEPVEIASSTWVEAILKDFWKKNISFIPFPGMEGLKDLDSILDKCFPKNPSYPK